jgi:hypothetical protein
MFIVESCYQAATSKSRLRRLSVYAVIPLTSSMYKCSVNPVTNRNPFYGHAYKWQYDLLPNLVKKNCNLRLVYCRKLVGKFYLLRISIFPNKFQNISHILMTLGVDIRTCKGYPSFCILVSIHNRQINKFIINIRGKSIPVTGCGGPLGCETSGLSQIGSQMAVRLSGLRAGRPLPLRKIPGTHFC